MAHRDPETGQFVSDGDGGISYSDHDVHHVKHLFSTDGASANPDDLRDTRRFEITERGLDPDEIAELRQMRIAINTRFKHNGNDNGPADATYFVDTGYNLAEGEFVSNDGNEVFDNDGDGTDDYFARFGETDEVGELYHEQGTVVGPQDDETNGIGIGGSFRQDVITIDMADMFGSGPFVDSADDFVSSIALDPQRQNGELGISLRYSLYYNVMKTEGGRSRFGR